MPLLAPVLQRRDHFIKRWPGGRQGKGWFGKSLTCSFIGGRLTSWLVLGAVRVLSEAVETRGSLGCSLCSSLIGTNMSVTFSSSNPSFPLLAFAVSRNTQRKAMPAVLRVHAVYSI